MREYDDYNDDSIRLYTPVLQRVIILAAVIIAVPVLMWTITTFVRSYVARPRVPALEHVAATTSTRIPLTAVPPSPRPSLPDQSPAPQIDAASASDTANAVADIKQATGNLAALPSSNSPAAASTPSAALQAPPMQAPYPASSPSAAAAIGDAAPASLARQSQPQAPRSNDGAAVSAGASSSDRAITWPNPNATNPPDFAAPRLASPAPPPARPATTDDLPAGEPVRGPIPLPRHRPSIFAIAGNMAASMAGTTTGTIAGPVATGGPVPLPRARPGDAPAEAANSVIEPAYGYRPGLDADR
jgi:hypothetical protein